MIIVDFTSPLAIAAYVAFFGIAFLHVFFRGGFYFRDDLPRPLAYFVGFAWLWIVFLLLHKDQLNIVFDLTVLMFAIGTPPLVLRGVRWVFAQIAKDRINTTTEEVIGASKQGA